MRARRPSGTDVASAAFESQLQPVWRSGPSARVAADGGRSKQPTILLVEDDETEARLLSTYLGGLGCQIRSARDVEGALQLLESDAVDLVVLDLLLPGRSGFALVEQMRNNPRHAQTPILIVSAVAEVQERVKALELGADDFIVKGFDYLEFQARP